MALDNIKLVIDNQFVGELQTPTGTAKVGDQEGGIMPYHMLFGALASCFYSTFLVISQKKRLTFDSAVVEVSGEKETGKEVNLLSKATVKVTVKNPSNEPGLRKSAELGAKFCSIYTTLSKIADITLVVEFE
ncbi:MAG TPA: OsmC family protein [Bacillota bacterium]|nr:OsmC family protein [Bacillota bacterium]